MFTAWHPGPSRARPTGAARRPGADSPSRDIRARARVPPGKTEKSEITKLLLQSSGKLS